MSSVPVAIIAIATVLGGCGKNNNEGVQSSVSVYGQPFDVKTGELQLFGLYAEKGIIQLSESENGEWIVYTKADKAGDVDLYVINRSSGLTIRVTETPDIEFDPAIDNSGTPAYAVHSYSVAESYVVLGDSRLEYPRGLHKALKFVGDSLISNYVKFYDDQHFVFIRSSQGDVREVLVPLIVSSLSRIDGSWITLQGVSQESGLHTVYRLNSQSTELEAACSTEPCYFYDGEIKVIESQNSRNATGELADAALMSKDPLCNLALANNYLGRLSWGVSYRLNGLLDLIQYGADLQSPVGYAPLRNMARRCALNLIAGASADPLLPGWPTKKYSISRNTELSLMVNNAAVMYPLVRAYNLSVLEESEFQSLLPLLKQLVDFYEPDFDQNVGAGGGYRFHYGIEYHLDGVVLPFNMQNLFGLALLELYDATGDATYQNRALQLARTFRAELAYTADGRLLWHYWPHQYYDGWSEDEDISSNTPSQPASVDSRYEDYSHASINVLSILEVYARSRRTGEFIFTQQDLEALQQTLQGMKNGFDWSRFISGDIDYQEPSLQFMPNFGWLKLADQETLDQIRKGLPAYYPFFESDLFAQYALTLVGSDVSGMLFPSNKYIGHPYN